MPGEAPKQAAARLWRETTAGESAESNDGAVVAAEGLIRLLEEDPALADPDESEVPHLGTAIGFLAHLEAQRGNWSRSGDLFEQAVEVFRHSESGGVAMAVSQLAHAAALAARDRAEDAVQTLSEATEVLSTAAAEGDGKALETLSRISDAASALGALDLAETALSSGIEGAASGGEGQAYLLELHLKRSQVVRAARGAAAALPLAETALRLARRHGSDLDVAAIASQVAEVLLELDRNEEALQLADEALDLAPESKPLRYGANRSRGVALAKRAEWDPALAAFQEALAGAIEVFGPGGKPVLQLHDQLASLLSELSRHREALPHLELLAEVATAREGHWSAARAERLHSLAIAWDELGAYSEAERWYGETLEILRRLHGEAHPEVLLQRFNLAEIARIQGNPETALRRFERLEPQLLAAGLGETDLAIRLNTNYGMTLIGIGRTEKARERLQTALRLVRELHGDDHPRHGRVLMALGQAEQARREYELAIEAFEAALEVFAGRTPFADRIETCELGIALARMHLRPGSEAAAEVETIGLQIESGVGQEAAEAAIFWHDIALEFVRVGEFDRARKALGRTARATTGMLISAAGSMSEKRLSATMEQLRAFDALHCSLVLMQDVPTSDELTAVCDSLLRTRGAETLALRLRGRVFLGDDATVQQQHIRKLRQRITRLELGVSTEQAAADLEHYREELEEAERTLARRTTAWRLDHEFLSASSENMLRLLPADCAVVEITRFGRLKANPGDDLVDSLRYGAFVLRGGAEHPVFADLGSVDRVDECVECFREAVAAARAPIASRDEAPWMAPGAELVELVIDPLRSSLGSISKVVVVPDGRLGLLPLGALPLANGRFLFEELEISYHFSSRRLARDSWLEEELGGGQSAVVIGAPDYGLSSGEVAAEAAEDGEFFEQFRSAGRFEPLAQSEAEVSRIAELLDVEAVVAERAVERVVREVAHPEALHISTHGFYLPRREASSPGTGNAILTGRETLSDPLERSGLALAGANAHLDGEALPDEVDDGILYASEVAGLQLMRTDLVTLSACQTGVGEVTHGDGVHSLQRAFLTAGARSVVCSLWEVPDKPTAQLFGGLYERLLDGEERGAALAAEVAELAARYPLHPVAWGGFVLYGETGKLTRFDPVRQLTVGSISLRGVGASAEAPTPALEGESLLARARAEAGGGASNEALTTLGRALKLQGLPERLRSELVYERAGVFRVMGRFAEALADYDQIEASLPATDTLRVSALFDRGTTQLLAGDKPQAIQTYGEFLDQRGLTAEFRSQALVNRGALLIEAGEHARGRADLAEVIDTPGMPPVQRAKARVQRAQLEINSGRLGAALDDATAALDEVEIDSADAANALLFSAIAVEDDDPETAAARYRAVLEIDGVPVPVRTLAESRLGELEDS